MPRGILKLSTLWGLAMYPSTHTQGGMIHLREGGGGGGGADQLSGGGGGAKCPPLSPLKKTLTLNTSRLWMVPEWCLV